MEQLNTMILTEANDKLYQRIEHLLGSEYYEKVDEALDLALSQTNDAVALVYAAMIIDPDCTHLDTSKDKDSIRATTLYERSVNEAELIKHANDVENNNNLWAQHAEGLRQYYYTKDFEVAADWFHKAATKGHAPSQYMLGMMYDIGLGVEKQNERLGLEWALAAANQGHGVAQIFVGSTYFNGARGIPKNLELAFKWYKQAAEHDSPLGMFNLAAMYDKGHYVEQNSELAIKWYKLAGEQYQSNSLYNLGMMYLRGVDHIEQSYHLALECFHKALERKKHSGCMISIGTMYCNGLGVEKDYKMALQYYRQAAELGSAVGIFNLGTLYARGQGVKPNLKMATKLFGEAATKEGYDTQAMVAWLYIKSLNMSVYIISAVIFGCYLYLWEGDLTATQFILLETFLYIVILFGPDEWFEEFDLSEDEQRRRPHDDNSGDRRSFPTVRKALAIMYVIFMIGIFMLYWDEFINGGSSVWGLLLWCTIIAAYTLIGNGNMVYNAGACLLMGYSVWSTLNTQYRVNQIVIEFDIALEQNNHKLLSVLHNLKGVGPDFDAKSKRIIEDMGNLSYDKIKLNRAKRKAVCEKLKEMIDEGKIPDHKCCPYLHHVFENEPDKDWMYYI